MRSPSGKHVRRHRCQPGFSCSFLSRRSQETTNQSAFDGDDSSLPTRVESNRTLKRKLTRPSTYQSRKLTQHSLIQLLNFFISSHLFQLCLPCFGSSFQHASGSSSSSFHRPFHGVSSAPHPSYFSSFCSTQHLPDVPHTSSSSDENDWTHRRSRVNCCGRRLSSLVALLLLALGLHVSPFARVLTLASKVRVSCLHNSFRFTVVFLVIACLIAFYLSCPCPSHPFL